MNRPTVFPLWCSYKCGINSKTVMDSKKAPLKANKSFRLLFIVGLKRTTKANPKATANIGNKYIIYLKIMIKRLDSLASNLCNL